MDKPDCDLSSQYDNGVSLFKLHRAERERPRLMVFGDYIITGSVVLALVAGTAYLFGGDYPRTVFWYAAAVLNTATIFFK